MYNKYIEDLLKYGNICFTLKQLIEDLSVSNSSAKKGLSLLYKKGKIISPLKGFYVIIPVEDSAYGSIPAKQLVPIIMKHLKADYYVGLLSAAAFYGAEHHKVFTFQVVTDKRMKPTMRFGQVRIDFIKKSNIKGLPTKDFTVKTGNLKVATPELTALDLFEYRRKAGEMNHIATTLAELTTYVDIDKLIELSRKTNQIYNLQRFAFVLEKIEIEESEEFKNEMLSKLEKYFSESEVSYVKLVPYGSIKGCARSEKWKIIENTDFESDL